MNSFFVRTLIAVLSLSFFSARFASARLDVEAGRELDLRVLIKARNSKELAKHIEGYQLEKRLRLVCDVQLRTGKVPSSCFTLLEQSSEPWLTELCTKRARTSGDTKELDSALANPRLPEKCRQAAQLRSGDLLYNAQAERPGELFERLYSSRKEN
jgi:hypothetical protein